MIPDTFIILGCTTLFLFVAKAVFSLKAAAIPEEAAIDVPSPELDELVSTKQRHMT